MSADVDIVIISCGKLPHLRKFTQGAIASCRKSSDKLIFNITVVETHEDGEKEYEGADRTVFWVPSDGQFNYNRVLNFGTHFGDAPYVVHANNDLRFHPHWAERLIQTMQKYKIRSVSPRCPRHAEQKKFRGQKEPAYGYAIRQEMSGWCVMMERSLWRELGGLWEDVPYWYSDVMYVDQLQAADVKHALVPLSLVTHWANRTTRKLPKEPRREMTQGAKPHYQKAKRIRAATMTSPYANLGFAKENVPGKELSTLKIGGPLRHVLRPNNLESLKKACLRADDRDDPVLMLGGGSNILFPDEGWPGLVILTKDLSHFHMENKLAVAWPGLMYASFLRQAALRNLAGVFQIAHVPGTMGGSVVMNAGFGPTEGKDIAKYLVRVEVFNREKAKTVTLTKEQCQFGYRTSIFRGRPDLLVLRSYFTLPAMDRKAAESTIVSSQKSAAKFIRACGQGCPNAGSVFIHTSYDPPKGVKGMNRGGACWSETNPNWINNLGGATAADVKWLIDEAKRLCKEQGKPEPELELIVV